MGSEIQHVLQLQRSSTLSCLTEKEPTEEGKISSHEIYNLSMFSGAEYCYSLLEEMPLPGPTWSTTEPCVLAMPLPPPSSAPPNIFEGSVELEWGENQASSYSWWLGFLQSLDEKKVAGMENAMVLSLEPSFVDAIDLSCCPDDWMMINPILEMDLEDHMAIP